MFGLLVLLAQPDIVQNENPSDFLALKNQDAFQSCLPETTRTKREKLILLFYGYKILKQVNNNAFACPWHRNAIKQLQ